MLQDKLQWFLRIHHKKYCFYFYGTKHLGGNVKIPNLSLNC